MNPQLAGIEQLSGTYVFDLRTSHRAFRINRFLWRMTEPDWRARFVSDAGGLMREAGLTDEEQQLVHNRDWIGLLRYGANFFVMEKIARVHKQSNLDRTYASSQGNRRATLGALRKSYLRSIPRCAAKVWMSF